MNHYENNKNLDHAKKLALSISSEGAFQQSNLALNWIGIANAGTNDSETVAIWANDSRINTGCITLEFASELSAFLERVEQESVDRFILCIDSAGVALAQSWKAMKATAKLIKQLLNLRLHNNVSTIAILGQEVGCYGGAYLLASGFQYVLGYKAGSYGVSGKKVIEHLNPSSNDMNALFYLAPYRVLNQEVFALLSESVTEQRDRLLTLQSKPLNRNTLIAEYNALKTCFLEDKCALVTSPTKPENNNQVLGFKETTQVGCDELFGFIEQLIPYLKEIEAHPLTSNNTVLPVIMGNCEQQFSFLNEQRGFSRYLSLCMKLLRYLSACGHPIRIKVDKRGSGATFIALSLMADVLIIEEGSYIFPLPDKAVSLLTHKALLTGNEWRSS